jgi:hypothetical protein
MERTHRMGDMREMRDLEVGTINKLRRNQKKIESGRN